MTARVDEVCYRDAYARSAEARVLEVAAGDGPPLVVLDTIAVSSCARWTADHGR
jgi:hypothetical protein